MNNTNDNNRFLVHLYGDSLSLPRKSIGVPYYLSYPELLREKWERLPVSKKVHLYNWSRGDATIESVFNEFKRESFYFSCISDILIIQIGICDCAPRPIPPWLRGIISLAPGFIRSRVIKLIRLNRAKIQHAGIKWQNTNPDIFESSYSEFLLKSLEEFKRIYLINIAPTTPKIEAHSPGLTLQINKYNQIIKNLISRINNQKIQLIDIHQKILNQPKDINSFIHEDGHHITAETHQLYAELIWEKEKILFEK